MGSGYGIILWSQAKTIKFSQSTQKLVSEMQFLSKCSHLEWQAGDCDALFILCCSLTRTTIVFHLHKHKPRADDE